MANQGHRCSCSAVADGQSGNLHRIDRCSAVAAAPRIADGELGNLHRIDRCSAVFTAAMRARTTRNRMTGAAAVFTAADGQCELRARTTRNRMTGAAAVFTPCGQPCVDRGRSRTSDTSDTSDTNTTNLYRLVVLSHTCRLFDNNVFNQQQPTGTLPCGFLLALCFAALPRMCLLSLCFARRRRPASRPAICHAIGGFLLALCFAALPRMCLLSLSLLCQPCFAPCHVACTLPLCSLLPCGLPCGGLYFCTHNAPPHAPSCL